MEWFKKYSLYFYIIFDFLYVEIYLHKCNFFVFVIVCFLIYSAWCSPSFLHLCLVSDINMGKFLYIIASDIFSFPSLFFFCFSPLPSLLLLFFSWDKDNLQSSIKRNLKEQYPHEHRFKILNKTSVIKSNLYTKMHHKQAVFNFGNSNWVNIRKIYQHITPL